MFSKGVKSTLRRSLKLDGLKCPYCDGMLPSHKALRIHIGRVHGEKIDEFMTEFFGGRSIEVDFITLMLQRAAIGLTPEFCGSCGRCNTVCPASRVNEDFKPLKVIEELRSNRVKDLLKSDLIWACTSCLACKDQCPDDTSPYNVIRTLWNLSARIDYHLPRAYKEMNKRISNWGYIQRDQLVSARSCGKLARGDLPLPDLKGPEGIEAFAETLKDLKTGRLVL